MWHYRRPLLGVFLVVITIGFIIIRDTQSPPAELPTPQGQVFPTINETQLREVRLSNPTDDNNMLTMTKATDGTWEIVDDSRQLDPAKVDVLLAVIANITFLESFPVDTDDFSQYGLSDKGQFLVEFTTDTGSTYRLTVGILGDRERTYAVRINESPQVFVIDRVPVDFLKISYQTPPIVEN